MNNEPKQFVRYFAGLDLGQANDFSALALIGEYATNAEWKESELRLDYLKRWSRGTTYPVIVDEVKEFVKRPQLSGGIALAIDGTGVGRAVVDMFTKEKVNASIYPVTITGGDTENYSDGYYRVPKRNLASLVQVALQTKALKMSRDLNLSDVLVTELANFKVKISIDTGHDSYGAWREGQHDDLVLGVSLALWVKKKGSFKVTQAERTIFQEMEW